VSNIVLVCGGRDFQAQDWLWSFLDRMHAEEPIDMLVHGDARGADYHAGCWAMSRGIPMAAVPANWDFYGTAAGSRRNHSMLLLKPSCVVAAPGGRGTEHMKMIARAHGIQVLDIN
jgi:YspA, cpYpsA-related SLOG family